MKKAIAGFVGVVGLVVFMVFVAWLDTEEATPFIIASLKTIGVALVITLALSIIRFRKQKKARRYVFSNVRHESMTGASLYIVTLDGYGEVVDYKLQEQFVGLSDYDLACWKTESISLEDVQEYVKGGLR